MPKFSQNLDCAHIKINEMIFTVWYETMAAYCIVCNTYRQLFDCCKVRDYAFSCCYCWVHCNSYYCCCCKPNYSNVAARRRLNAPAQGNWRHKILVHLYPTHTHSRECYRYQVVCITNGTPSAKRYLFNWKRRHYHSPAGSECLCSP